MPPDIDIPKLTELFTSYSGIINTLWTLFSTVALAALGFLYKDGDPTGKTPLKSMLTIAFVLFAAGNCTAICRHQTMLHSISVALKAAQSRHQAVLDTFIAASPGKMVVVHVGFTVAVIAVIWLPGLLTKKRA
jgi:hypothetical protein